MNNIAKIALSAVVLLSLGSATASADVKKGQILYMKKLKKVCGMTGAEMAEKHTMSEWETLFTKGKLGEEIKSFCPKVKDKSIQEKYMQHYFDFFKEYGSDSGNIPAC
jgi:hypothetical protein